MAAQKTLSLLCGFGRTQVFPAAIGDFMSSKRPYVTSDLLCSHRRSHVFSTAIGDLRFFMAPSRRRRPHVYYTSIEDLRSARRQQEISGMFYGHRGPQVCYKAISELKSFQKTSGLPILSQSLTFLCGHRRTQVFYTVIVDLMSFILPWET